MNTPMHPTLTAVHVSPDLAHFSTHAGRTLTFAVPLLVSLQERGPEVDVHLSTPSGTHLHTFSAPSDSPALQVIARELLSEHHPLKPMPAVQAVTAAQPPVLIVEGQRGNREAVRAGSLTAPRLYLHWSGAAQLVDWGGTRRAYFIPPELVSEVRAALPHAQAVDVPAPGPDQWG
ncbi:hypothetical protein [Deinococcus sedimenti]|uniref:Uncharacterized protein n=1 Tax=Deinococcus sedimenti TaxID=1867090 RepID=A0ABQ2S7T2_9DEIO|nr:hypothetical protein [Deinococcus sedimenti]GGS00804.1 hypothetical protein GCM10008960_29420 [Deinococcus sedimenti]